MSLKNLTANIGSVSGVLGAVLIALNLDLGALGYGIFIVSSVSWIIHSSYINSRQIMGMNLVFLIINIIGLCRFL